MIEYKRIRLKFSKLGAAKFISHLDLDRTMKTVITRSGLNAEYSHGFNPRPYLVFSLPLPVGVESVCEYLDIRIADDVPMSEIQKRLNDNLPPDIRINEVYLQESPFKLIYSSRYEYTLTSPDLTDDFPSRATELFKAPVIIEKHTKKTASGVMDFDIQPFVYEFSAFKEGKSIKINTLLSAAPDCYINPENLMQAFSRYLNAAFTDPTKADYGIVRIGVYKADGSDFK